MKNWPYLGNGERYGQVLLIAPTIRTFWHMARYKCKLLSYLLINSW